MLIMMSCRDLKLDYERYPYKNDLLNMCRLCWTINDLKDFTSCSLNPNEKGATIAEKIQECVGVDVTIHTHLKNICTKCLNQIEMFMQFKRFCQYMDKKLHDILQKGSKQSIPFQLSKQILKLENEDLKFMEKENELNLEIECLESKKEKIEIDILKLELDSELMDLGSELSGFAVDNLNYENVTSVTSSNKPESNIEACQNKLSLYCYMCHMHFELLDDLREHKLQYHRTYKCYGCEKIFKSPQLRLHHENKNCNNLKNGYKCDVCDKYLPKRNFFMRHIRSHKGNTAVLVIPDDIYTCDKCSKPFDNAKCLRDHLHTHYKKRSIRNTYICEICGKVSNSKGNLDVHKLTHANVKPLKCPHCDYRTGLPSSLTIHIRSHTGERPYACDLCPQRCVSSSNLKKHRKLHFGIKEFECNICQKRFTQKNELNEHITIVHKNLKSHVCEHCDAEYTRFKSLREHLLVKHGLKVRKVKGAVVEVASGINYKRKKKTKQDSRE